MDSIKQNVTAILKKYTFNEDVWVGFNENSSIIKDLKINSARVVDIILDLEELYDIDVTDDELDKLNCFKDIVTLISEKTK